MNEQMFSYAMGKTILNLSSEIISDDKFEIDLIPSKSKYDNIYLGIIDESEITLRDLINKCYNIVNDYGFVFFTCKYGNDFGQMNMGRLIKFVNYETYFKIYASQKINDDYFITLRKVV